MSWTAHQFDAASVVNPVTGLPYGPGPLWAGSEPMDYPDPLCVCGGYWVDDQCTLRGTFYGASFEFSQACRELGAAIARQAVSAFRALWRW